MSEPAVKKTVRMNARSGSMRLLEWISEFGFLTMATLVAIVFFLMWVQWIAMPGPIGLLVLAAWCVFYWIKYWVAARQDAWGVRYILVCAAFITAATLLGAIVLGFRWLR